MSLIDYPDQVFIWCICTMVNVVVLMIFYFLKTPFHEKIHINRMRKLSKEPLEFIVFAPFNIYKKDKDITYISSRKNEYRDELGSVYVSGDYKNFTDSEIRDIAVTPLLYESLFVLMMVVLNFIFAGLFFKPIWYMAVIPATIITLAYTITLSKEEYTVGSDLWVSKNPSKFKRMQSKDSFKNASKNKKGT